MLNAGGAMKISDLFEAKDKSKKVIQSVGVQIESQNRIEEKESVRHQEAHS